MQRTTRIGVSALSRTDRRFGCSEDGTAGASNDGDGENNEDDDSELSSVVTAPEQEISDSCVEPKRGERIDTEKRR